MNIAILSDIHANLPALQAVINHALLNGVSTFYCAGDLVGYGPFPNEVIGLIKNINIQSVIGDYDLKVLHFEDVKNKWRSKKQPLKFLAFEWAHDMLSPSSISFLKLLPEKIEFSISAFSILITHGIPSKIGGHISPLATTSQLRKIAKSNSKNIIITGNTHQFMHKKVDHTHFINPGSVGRPDDGIPHASYGILAFVEEGHNVHFSNHRIPYDISQIITKFKEYELPEEFCAMFIQGKSLDFILNKS